MNAWIDGRTDGWIEILDEWAGSVWIPQDTYINVFSLVITFVTIKQFDPGQRRQSGADFDANHFHGVVFFVFPEVCSLSDLGNIADSDQVLRKMGSGRTL